MSVTTTKDGRGGLVPQEGLLAMEHKAGVMLADFDGEAAGELSARTGDALTILLSDNGSTMPGKAPWSVKCRAT